MGCNETGLLTRVLQDLSDEVLLMTVRSPMLVVLNLRRVDKRDSVRNDGGSEDLQEHKMSSITWSRASDNITNLLLLLKIRLTIWFLLSPLGTDWRCQHTKAVMEYM